MNSFATADGNVPAFDSEAVAFNLSNAWWLAKCSLLAYQSKPNVAYELELAGFTSVTFVDFSGSQGYVAAYPPTASSPKGFVVVAFRGTENDWNDILTDITFVKTKLPDEDYRAHAGFVYALKDVWGTSLGSLRNQKIRVEWYGLKGISDALDVLIGIPTFVTGHSLGGALATLAAYYWPPRALYTFGSPRVVSWKLADVFRKRKLPGFRVVNSTDIVTRVPFAFWGFRHVGEIGYFTSSGRLLTVGKALFSYLLGSIQTWLLPLAVISPYALIALAQPAIFTNHRISNYIDKLARQFS